MELAQFVEDVERAVVWKRDGGICKICGDPADIDAWDLDHIIPLSHGGEHSYANTAVSHPTCNNRKYVFDPRTDPRYAHMLAS
jgi:5-methylcytosine-specific restriction endonuclease McrA